MLARSLVAAHPERGSRAAVRATHAQSTTWKRTPLGRRITQVGHDGQVPTNAWFRDEHAPPTTGAELDGFYHRTLQKDDRRPGYKDSSMDLARSVDI